MANSHPFSVGIPEHMLATCLQVFDLLSQSTHWFGDDRPNCEAIWYPGIYAVRPKTWLQIVATIRHYGLWNPMQTKNTSNI
jgi:hypothetical protein